jgi:hypothetical protein
VSPRLSNATARAVISAEARARGLRHRGQRGSDDGDGLTTGAVLPAARLHCTLAGSHRGGHGPGLRVHCKWGQAGVSSRSFRAGPPKATCLPFLGALPPQGSQRWARAPRPRGEEDSSLPRQTNLRAPPGLRPESRAGAHHSAARAAHPPGVRAAGSPSTHAYPGRRRALSW